MSNTDAELQDMTSTELVRSPSEARTPEPPSGEHREPSALPEPHPEECTPRPHDVDKDADEFLEDAKKVVASHKAWIVSKLKEAKVFDLYTQVSALRLASGEARTVPREVRQKVIQVTTLLNARSEVVEVVCSSCGGPLKRPHDRFEGRTPSDVIRWINSVFVQGDREEVATGGACTNRVDYAPSSLENTKDPVYVCNAIATLCSIMFIEDVETQNESEDDDFETASSSSGETPVPPGIHSKHCKVPLHKAHLKHVSKDDKS